MSDEFKMTPLEQVKEQLLDQMRAQQGVAVFEVPRDNYVVKGIMHTTSGERIELIDSREYTRVLDRAHLAEDRYAHAEKEIAELQTIIKYLEERNGRTEKGSVQVGDRQSVPCQDGRTSPAPETD